MMCTCVGLRKQMALRCFMVSRPGLLMISKRYTSFCRISDCEYTILTMLIWVCVRVCVCGGGRGGDVLHAFLIVDFNSFKWRAGAHNISLELTVSLSMRRTFIPAPLSLIIRVIYCFTPCTTFIVLPSPLLLCPSDSSSTDSYRMTGLLWYFSRLGLDHFNPSMYSLQSNA